MEIRVDLSDGHFKGFLKSTDQANESLLVVRSYLFLWFSHNKTNGHFCFFFAPEHFCDSLVSESSLRW